MASLLFFLQYFICCNKKKAFCRKSCLLTLYFNILVPGDCSPMPTTLSALLGSCINQNSKGSRDLTKVQQQCQKTMEVNNQDGVKDWRVHLRICLSFMSRRLFVVPHSPRSFLSVHISVHSMFPGLSPSPVSTCDRAMLFLLTAVCSVSAHSSLLEGDAFLSFSSFLCFLPFHWFFFTVQQQHLQRNES